MNTILHVFAESIEGNLLTLKKEQEALLLILQERETASEYRYVQLCGASLEEIEQAITRYENELLVFQFSGHAGEQNLLIQDLEVNGGGIAMQLQRCVANHSLQLVILNGCSTHALAKAFEQYEIPAVIYTTAPVYDMAATWFSIQFWRSLITYNTNISVAFSRAVAAAQSRTQVSLKDNALWQLSAGDAEKKTNPVHYLRAEAGPEAFTPNSILFPVLYREFLKAGNLHLAQLEGQGKSMRMSAMLNSIPHPVSTHLQKLFSPLEPSPEGYDQITLKRLEQIGQLYQNTAEFCWYIVVAQLWEVMLEFPQVRDEIDADIRHSLWEFFSMRTEQRETFDFISVMKQLLDIIKQLEQDSRYTAFIATQIICRDFIGLSADFYSACEYLLPLRINTYEGTVLNRNIGDLCKSAEQQLTQFLKPLSFMHRYKLTSIQNINVIKLRHTKQAYTRYKHKMTFLMNARGGEESSFYYMRSFIDTWSVILIKDEKCRKAQSIEEPTFVTMFVDFLNLSPFVIDQNIYLKDTTLSDIMFFRGFFPNGTAYKRVSNTLDKKDIRILPVEDNYSPLTKQFRNFKKIVLGNRP